MYKCMCIVNFLVLLLLVFTSAEVPDDLDESTVSEEGKVIHEEILDELPYVTPKPVGHAYIAETFDDVEAYKKKWILSQAKKKDATEEIKYEGLWQIEAPVKNGMKGDFGLVLKSKAKLHAISAKLDEPYVFQGKPFVLQYEVTFQEGQECGGAYLKLLTETSDLQLREFHDKVPYTIMFGPDKCGTENNVHFIFRHKNPKNGSIEEKHWKKSKNLPKLDDVFKDKKPHLFTLIVNPDNLFEIRVDGKAIESGSLLKDVDPPVNPPTEIDDPNDKKPSDWDEKPKIPDPDAMKPDDWVEDAPKEMPDMKAEKPSGWLDDEEDMTHDPDAVKPKDWDDEMDGEWEAPLIKNSKCEGAPGCGKWERPLIPNPEYKGKWKPPIIDNPNYKGTWKPKRIPNPDFFEDMNPYAMMPIGAVGLELWSMSDNILFDNILITDHVGVAEQFAEDSWAQKKERADSDTDSVLTKLIKYTNKRPWLWAVYILVIALPVVLLIVFCCSGSSSQEKKLLEEKKKQDITEADIEEEEEEGGEPSEEKTGDQLGSDDVENDDRQADEEEKNVEETITNASDEASGVRKSPRKRRPRKVVD